MTVVEEVRRRLALAADPGRAPAMQAYMKSAMPFRGVPAADVRKICRAALEVAPLEDEASWVAAVRELWDAAVFREERYAAIAVAGDHRHRPHQQPRTLDLYRHLVTIGAWWDLVDPVATKLVGGIVLAHRDETTPVVRGWAEDEDLWLRRTAILCQLHHKDRTDVALLAQVVEQNLEGTRHGHEFFVRKAIGWALREHAKTDPQWVTRFVERHRSGLSGLSRREALKHQARSSTSPGKA